jgi:hypothetical protein
MSTGQRIMLVAFFTLIVAAVTPLVLAGFGLREPRAANAQYPVAVGCCTRFGRCPLGGPLPPGAGCFCASPYGPIGGFAC